MSEKFIQVMGQLELNQSYKLYVFQCAGVREGRHCSAVGSTCHGHPFTDTAGVTTTVPDELHFLTSSTGMMDTQGVCILAAIVYIHYMYLTRNHIFVCPQSAVVVSIRSFSRRVMSKMYQDEGMGHTLLGSLKLLVRLGT